ncbi:amidohydrolase family protein [Winogradskya humida]|uniref:Amidohydrolase n=1 Tax=Winogradskya humida TaxID=113566 RepID=A0ABQ3ZGX2_9ACTN|nr:amidohydrolase family protein [Actinoplanes humidus]GIE17841.1 amidohydrolase [Actinoplanes humidus]
MGRIDVHHHAILPEISRLMRELGAPFTIPWSAAETDRVMAEHDIDVAVISNAVPGDFFSDARRAGVFHRAVNVAVAEYVAEQPGRFGLLSALPMPYVDLALEEVRHSFDVLGADGVLLVPHSGESYLGDPLYEPLFEELNRRSAVVLVHPMALPGPAAAQVPYVLADFLLDTTRGALSLILSGALDRYPDIRFVLSHGGGFLPYAATRADLLAPAFFGVEPGLVKRSLDRFYYDTALTGASGLPSLLSTVGPERVVFGTDWCAAPETAVREVVAALNEPWPQLADGARDLVDRGNALRLFPRFGDTPEKACLRDASSFRLSA